MNVQDFDFNWFEPSNSAETKELGDIGESYAQTLFALHGLDLELSESGIDPIDGRVTLTRNGMKYTIKVQIKVSNFVPRHDRPGGCYKINLRGSTNEKRANLRKLEEQHADSPSRENAKKIDMLKNELESQKYPWDFLLLIAVKPELDGVDIALIPAKEFHGRSVVTFSILPSRGHMGLAGYRKNLKYSKYMGDQVIAKTFQL